MHKDEEAIFFPDESGSTSTSRDAWRILIVDDDEFVHSATQFALEGLLLLGRPIEFLHAYSGIQARALLEKEVNIAVVLLDVVMESDDAALQLARYIREDLALEDVRIILRTGQPGYAPEAQVIRNFDINDDKIKSKLMRSQLVSTLTGAVRSYRQLSTATQSQQRLTVENQSAELRLREDEARFRSIASASRGAIIVTDHSHRVEIWNQGAERIFGLTTQGVIGKLIRFTIPQHYHDERNRTFATVSTIPREGAEFTISLSPLPRNQEHIPLELTIALGMLATGCTTAAFFVTSPSVAVSQMN
jgi:PAS domain S-box-containing protein